MVSWLLLALLQKGGGGNVTRTVSNKHTVPVKRQCGCENLKLKWMVSTMGFRWTESIRSLLIELGASGHWEVKVNGKALLIDLGSLYLPTCPLIPPSQVGVGGLRAIYIHLSMLGDIGEEKESNCMILLDTSAQATIIPGPMREDPNSNDGIWARFTVRKRS